MSASAELHPRARALHQFREDVVHGLERDNLGNRFFIHSPAGDTFFSCLSFAQYRSNGYAQVLRNSLLEHFIGLLTGEPCESVEAWAMCNDAASFALREKAGAHPAIRSMLATHAGTNDEARLNRLLATEEGEMALREAALQFVRDNLKPGQVRCRLVFAYLYCEQYNSDVVFYRARRVHGGRGHEHQAVQREYEIYKLDGKARCAVSVTPAERKARRKRHCRKCRGKREVAVDDDDDDESSCSSVSDSDSFNWMTTYLLYAEDEYGGSRFELLHTPDINSLRTGYQPDVAQKRMQRYQVRMVYTKRTLEGDMGLENTSIRRGGVAYMSAPATRGWKVYSLLMRPDELYPERVYQVHTGRAGSMLDQGIGRNRTIFVYLYFLQCSGHPKAVFVSSLNGSPYVTAPSFAITDDRLGTADGVLAVVTDTKKHADMHVQLETGVEVESPGFDEEEQDVVE